MSTPIDEYFELKKEANTFWRGLTTPGNTTPFQRGAQTRQAGLQAGLQIGTAVAAAAAIPAGQALIGALTKRHDYNRMMEHNPDLHDMKSENPKMFNQMYTSLRNANPEYGRDPLIAGSHMRKMMDQPDVAGLALTEAIRGRTPSQGEFSTQSPRDVYIPMGTKIKT